MFDIAESNSLIVDTVLYALIAFSVVTWTLLLVKGYQHWRAASQSKRYKQAFWSAPNIIAASEIHDVDGPAARVAQAGFNTLRDVDGHASHDLEHTGDRQDLLERSLRQQILKERRSLDSGLAVLASIGSTSPFVGLFGTVWGIMNALTNIGALGSASLEVVAGPIGEALVATGLGIAVAVPAVLAFNFFTRRLKLINGDLDDFAADLIRLSRKANFAGSKPVELGAVKHEATSSSVVNLKNEAVA
ncbi:MotA/TolQ/ExbB proton channel family protein [Methylobacillus methanolivorans]